VSIFIIVEPMEFQINVMHMAAYRDVVIGVVTWLLLGRPSSLRFDCGKGHLSWVGIATYISSYSVGDGALSRAAEWAMPEIDHVIHPMPSLWKRKFVTQIPLLPCTRPLGQVYS